MGTNSHAHVTLRGELLRHSWEINDLHFSSSGTLLVSSSYMDPLCIWDVSEQKLVREIPPRVDTAHIMCSTVSSLDFIAAGLDSGEIDIWASDGTLVDSIVVDTQGNLSLAFSPIGSTLIAINEFGVVRLWDMVPTRLLSSFSAAPHSNTTSGGKLEQQHVLAISPDGSLLAIDYPSELGAIQLWEIDKRGAMVRWVNALMSANGSTTIYHLAFSSDGSILAVASGGRIHLLEVSSGAIVGVRRIPDNIINRLAFQRDGHLLAGAGSKGLVSVWQEKNPQPMISFEAHSESTSWAVQDIAWAPRGNLFATCGWQLVQQYRARSSVIKRPVEWQRAFPIRLWQFEEA